VVMSVTVKVTKPSDYDRIRAESPCRTHRSDNLCDTKIQSTDGKHRVCSRPPGHEGPHVAYAWTDDKGRSTSLGAEAKPLAYWVWGN